jgi:hypothetical protein
VQIHQQSPAVGGATATRNWAWQGGPAGDPGQVTTDPSPRFRTLLVNRSTATTFCRRAPALLKR